MMVLAALVVVAVATLASGFQLRDELLMAVGSAAIVGTGLLLWKAYS